MKPTIGRIVHFVVAAPIKVAKNGRQHLPAIIYEVYEGGVSLEVFGGFVPNMMASVPYDETARGIWNVALGRNANKSKRLAVIGGSAASTGVSGVQRSATVPGEKAKN
jgi:hypothetical protein